MLILVRHGQSVFNEKKLLSGSTDVELTDLGRQQAIECGLSLADTPVDHLFTSQLQRAVETADLILEHGKLKPKTRFASTELNERSYGVLEGLTLGECRAKFPPKKYKTWERDYWEAPPMGESMADVAGRVIPFYTHQVLPKLRLERTVLIVAHANVIKVLLGFIRGADENSVFDMQVENATPMTIPLDMLNLKGSCAP